MTEAKSKIKHAALLRTFTDLNPVLGNLRRWSATCDMRSHFISFREDVIRVDIDENGGAPVDTSKNISADSPKVCFYS